MLKHFHSILGLVILAAVCAGCASHHPETLKVLSFNIHHCQGLDGRTDLERIARVIAQTKADLVALQEVDQLVERSNRIDQPRRLAELTRMHVVFGKNIDFQGGGYGNAVLSRFPIEHHQNHLLPKFQSHEQRGLLEAHMSIGDQKLIFFATHFDHHSQDDERMACMATLRELVELREQLLVIVAGDLNDVPDSRAMLEAASFLYNTLDLATVLPFTFRADNPSRTIDYILYNRHRALKCIAHRVIPESIASDHRPILAEFEVRMSQ